MKLIPALAIGLAFVGVLSAAPAQAQNRAFVSAGGSDGNACSFVAPCRSLQHAHDTVTANGEIDVLDPAGYGPLIINRPISINGHGYAEILVGNGGTGITINANAGEAINLSGLIIDGQGVGAFGIVFNSGGSLTVGNTIIRTVITDGIRFTPGVSIEMFASLFVSNSQMSNNGSAGIFVFPSGQTNTRVVLNHVETNNNGNFGVLAKAVNAPSGGTILISINDSIASGNGSVGFYTFSQGPINATQMLLFRSVANYNVTGAAADGQSSTMFVGQSELFANQIDWNTLNNGQINSFQDNYSSSGPNPTFIGKR